MEQHLITREIGIDAGHRVTYHGSKCKNIHGHRYTIRATCVGPLFTEGEQQGMVLDFGFLKEEMMNEIDLPCDHGMMLWIDDPILKQTLSVEQLDYISKEMKINPFNAVNFLGNETFSKLYITPFVPTAENLAKHWAERLIPRVKYRTDGQAHLKLVKVWETPNCSATYIVPEGGVQ